MSRKRNQSFAETSLSSDLHGAFMEPPGLTNRADGDFLELEHDEELLCSVSDITEHLGRNITVVLETALLEIRKMVSIRIRVLKMELREKSEEIEALKARLDTVQRDGREPFPGVATMEQSADAAFKKHDFSSANKHNSFDPRRAKAVMPGVKKENIDAICDYLMKDKNSRGCAEMDGDQSSQASGDREARPDPDPHSLNLWPDSSITGSGAGDSESTTDDLFSMLPSGSKRMYDYEWIAPMDYSSDLKVMKEPECDNPPTGETEDEEDEEEEESSEREGSGLEQTQTPLSHVQPSEFSMGPQSSPGEGGSPLEANTDQPVAESDYELKGEDEIDRRRGPKGALRPAYQHPAIGAAASASTMKRIKEDAGDPSARPSYPSSSESKVAVGSNKRRRCTVCGPRMDRKTQHTCIKCNKYICAAHTVKICQSCVV